MGALNAAVAAHGSTTVKATCARAAKSLHQRLHLLRRHLRRRLRLTHVQADIQRNRMTATTRAAKPVPVEIAQSAAMAAIWSRTQPKALSAWRTRCWSEHGIAV